MSIEVKQVGSLWSGEYKIFEAMKKLSKEDLQEKTVYELVELIEVILDQTWDMQYDIRCNAMGEEL